MSDRPTPEQLRNGFTHHEQAFGADEYHRRLISFGYVIVHPDDIPTRDPDEDEGGPDYWARGWNRCRQVVFGVSDE